MLKGKCPYCKKKDVMLIKHLLDNDTNLTTLMCLDCHKNPLILEALAKKQFTNIDESGHFGKQGDTWNYIERKRK